jgi:nucleoside-diphosphate-sugar epimerase
MNRVVEIVAQVTNRQPKVIRTEREKGDVTHTGADVTRAREDLGYSPQVSIEQGLAAEARYIEEVVLPLGL